MSTKTLPAALPGGALLPYMSAQRFNQIASTVFEMCGGVQRLAHIANKSDEDFKWFMEKVYVKAQPRHMSLDTAATGIETLLKKAKQINDEGVIDITPTEVEHAD